MPIESVKNDSCFDYDFVTRNENVIDCHFENEIVSEKNWIDDVYDHEISVGIATISWSFYANFDVGYGRYVGNDVYFVNPNGYEIVRRNMIFEMRLTHQCCQIRCLLTILG